MAASGPPRRAAGY